jgi:hypothetical protein
MLDEHGALSVLLGQQVVLDLASHYCVLGTFVGADVQHYILEQADVHDLRDTATTRELYVLDARRHGINPNRRRVFIRRADVVALSLLADVLP